jgi:REP element-mobilizing transposase RayT
MKSRKSIRWKGYDYSSNGAYFVTICTRNRENLLCNIKDNQAVLTKFGEIVQEEWCNLTCRSSDLELDEFTIMPNHIHGIGEIIGSFKSLSDCRCRGAFAFTNPDRRFGRLWQRNFHDRVIRNILTWEKDDNFPEDVNQSGT